MRLLLLAADYVAPLIGSQVSPIDIGWKLSCALSPLLGTRMYFIEPVSSSTSLRAAPVLSFAVQHELVPQTPCKERDAS